MTSRRTRYPTVTMALAMCVAVMAARTPAAAQATKKVLAIDDYSRWRSITGQRISGDGKWVVYEYRFTNTAEPKPVLHILQLDSGKDQDIANGAQAVFSDDSRWVAYAIIPPDAGGRGRGGRGGGGGGGGGGGAPVAPVTPVTPVTPGAPGAPPAVAGRGGPVVPPASRHVELRNLVTGATTVVKSWDDVQSFSFAPGSSYLQLRRQAIPGAANKGVDVLLHDLANGTDQLLGSVNELAFNKPGNLLAYTVDAAVRDGNGLFVFDLRSGRVHALDNDARNYSRLTWNDNGTALAVLKGIDVDRQREKSNVLIAFTDVPAKLAGTLKSGPVKLDPATAAGWVKDWVVSERRELVWSDNGKLVYFGIKPQLPAPDTAARRRGAAEVADVDVWNSNDPRIQSVQMADAESELNTTFRAAFDLTAGKLIKLADSTLRDVDLTDNGRWAVGRDARSYISDYERARADLYRVNPATGERTLIGKNQQTQGNTFGMSPDGKYFVYWKDKQFNAYDLDAGTSKVISGAAPVNYTDMEWDYPGERPAYGLVGYTTDNKWAVVEHRYDIWLLPLDGVSAPRNLTNGMGAKSEMKFGYVRTDPDAPAGGPGGGGGGGGGGDAAAVVARRRSI